jgi:hypothetical protein
MTYMVEGAASGRGRGCNDLPADAPTRPLLSVRGHIRQTGANAGLAMNIGA